MVHRKKMLFILALALLASAFLTINCQRHTSREIYQLSFKWIDQDNENHCLILTPSQNQEKPFNSHVVKFKDCSILGPCHMGHSHISDQIQSMVLARLNVIEESGIDLANTQGKLKLLILE